MRPLRTSIPTLLPEGCDQVARSRQRICRMALLVHHERDETVGRSTPVNLVGIFEEGSGPKGPVRAAPSPVRFVRLPCESVKKAERVSKGLK